MNIISMGVKKQIHYKREADVNNCPLEFVSLLNGASPGAWKGPKLTHSPRTKTDYCGGR